jgi:hypothetical protein
MTTLKPNVYKNFVTDDAAEINFGSRLDPSNLPTTAKAINAMNNGDGDGKITLDLEKLVYVKTIKGGIRNPDARHHRYTTEHQTYHVYIVSERYTPDEIERLKLVGLNVDNTEVGEKAAPDGDVQFSRGMHLVVVSVNGSGNKWITLDYCDKGNSVLYAVQSLPNCVAHDVLNTIFDAYSHGHAHGSRTTARKYKTAFVEGRLKKRKVRGQDAYNVEIEEPPIDMSKPVLIKVGGSSPFDN